MREDSPLKTCYTWALIVVGSLSYQLVRRRGDILHAGTPICYIVQTLNTLVEAVQPPRSWREKLHDQGREVFVAFSHCTEAMTHLYLTNDHAIFTTCLEARS